MLTRIKNLFKKNGANKEVGQGLAPGVVAPDFSMVAADGQQVSLGQFQGRPVVLVFYPADESSVCSDQLALYNEALHLFDEYEAQLLAISVDDRASHQAFAQSLGLKFPLLSDDNPAGAVGERYGVFDHSDGKSDRALFVINDEGLITWSQVSPRRVNPGAHGILAALELLK